MSESNFLFPVRIIPAPNLVVALSSRSALLVCPSTVAITAVSHWFLPPFSDWPAPSPPAPLFTLCRHTGTSPLSPSLPPCSFAYPRQPHSVTLPSPVPVCSHAKTQWPNVDACHHLPYLLPYTLCSLCLLRADHDQSYFSLYLIGGNYRRPTTALTLTTYPPSPPPPSARFRASLRAAAGPPPRSPGSLPQAHESCITSGNERFDFSPRTCRK